METRNPMTSEQAGGAGVEYYFGYSYEESDLLCQNFRSRATMWDQSRYVWKFFIDNDIPFQDMTSDDTRVSNDNWLLVDKITGNVIVVYLRQGGTATVDLAPLGSKSQFSVQWFDPRNGGRLQEGSIQSLPGGQVRPLGEAPNNRAKDWAVLLRCEKGC
jgi:hypothetical protein